MIQACTNLENTHVKYFLIGTSFLRQVIQCFRFHLKLKLVNDFLIWSRGKEAISKGELFPFLYANCIPRSKARAYDWKTLTSHVAGRSVPRNIVLTLMILLTQFEENVQRTKTKINPNDNKGLHYRKKLRTRFKKET